MAFDTDAWRARSFRLGARLDTLAGCVGLVLMGVHGWVVASLAVDVPHADEWEILRPDALDHDLRPAWLWRPHNEHRMVFTKLLQWLLYRCGKLHLPTQTALNFMLYTGLCVLVMVGMHRVLRVRGAFLWLPLASVLLWDVHYWSFQSHFHLYLLFFVASLWALYRGGRALYGAAPLAACSAFSFSSGLVCTIWAAAAAIAMARLRPERRSAYLLQAFFMGLVLAAWCLPELPPMPRTTHAWPWASAFWQHLGSTWARGFGINQIAPWPGGLAIIAAGLALGVQRFRALRTAPTETRVGWTLALVFGLAMLSCTALVSAGRANTPETGLWIAPRYVACVLLCLPLLWALLSRALAEMPDARAVSACRAAACIVLLVPFADELNAHHTYAPHHAKLVALRACTDAWQRGENDGVCAAETAFRAGDVRAYLERARVLRLSFVQGPERH